jgi:hypothetical protein
MKTNSFSLRRRHIMIGAAAIASAPASAFTLLRGAPALAPALGAMGMPRSGEKLVVSGRLMDGNGKPIANATLEAWHSHVHRTTVTSDGDGRLMFTTTTPEGREGIAYRITRANRSALQGLLRLGAATSADDALAHLHVDEAGVWRTSFALTLA